ncbi:MULTISPECIES: hypothetical protein [unclassified Novosphingobium]|uniref:hypothetical protein n=1 Tax=unclassified Novosphingobium TaxID=2644732 RepID=UPI00146CE0AF|nr:MULTISPECIES: hypothetical protein [unclassified Novosphingobium]NMN05181.1 hypothetical protein [Novosphingobium sp. SG919]NMN87476.1 hypothetical protein [Novosphingobium sp. SG916]
MKVLSFTLGLIGATLFSLCPLPVLFMAECQLNERPDEVAACFANVEHIQNIYLTALAVLFFTALALQLRGSRWTVAALFALAIAPPASIFVA